MTLEETIAAVKDGSAIFNPDARALVNEIERLRDIVERRGGHPYPDSRHPSELPYPPSATA